MSKSDTPFNQLKLSKAYTPPRKPDFAGDTKINAFDTETADGSVFALSYSFEGYPPQVIADKNFLSSEEIFNKITNRRARSAINCWYNLNFDANVMLNHLLNREQWAILSVQGTVELDDYTITFIPSKFLKIKDLNKNVYYHYDVSQFFYGSLEAASQEWLDREKLTEIADTKKFGKNEAGDGVNDYIRKHWEDILTYAKRDADLTRDLWKQAVEIGETDLSIPMGKPFSTGFLAESYLNEHLSYKPGIGDTDIAKMAWESYAGGRFEVIKRGEIGQVSGPDINSAYPYVLSNLPDPKTLQWRRYDSPTIDQIREADYGFLELNVSTYKDRPIQPFADKMNDMRYFPYYKKNSITVLKDIFEFAYNNEYVKDYEITNSWLAKSYGYTDYPFQFINDLYQERKEFESIGHFKKGQLLKIILNSMYGKTCQTTPKRRELGNNEEPLRNDTVTETYLSPTQLPEPIRLGYQNGIVEFLEAGSWFNPFLASYITGLTRLELHKQIVNYGLEDHTVMLATDSLMIEQNAFEKSDFANDLVKSGLGNWDYDYTGNAFVIGAGVYEIIRETCQKKTCNKFNSKHCKNPKHYLKVKTRGFKERDLLAQYDSLRDAADNHNEKIPVETTRPKGAAELIWQNDSLNNVGKFETMTRELSADFDKAREWQSKTDYSALRTRPESSRPLRAKE